MQVGGAGNGGLVEEVVQLQPGVLERRADRADRGGLAVVAEAADHHARQCRVVHLERVAVQSALDQSGHLRRHRSLLQRQVHVREPAEHVVVESAVDGQHRPLLRGQSRRGQQLAAGATVVLPALEGVAVQRGPQHELGEPFARRPLVLRIA
ncbi:hypothetical protein [Kitasatospora sp. RG8]|uniref:hypothetical protein n=1 Tax=Kitasatospora sp. RG8 TaxID=2820815 RepID=UPI001FD7A237|nr:hypothetical protein [Kitasatospora sp. RG8]